MKKTLIVLVNILLISAFLVSICGCGGLFNGDKKLTADKLVAQEGDHDKDITLHKVYAVTNNLSTTHLWITFTKCTDGSLDLIRLTKNGDNSYSKKSFSILSRENKGFDYFPEGTCADAYVLGKKKYSYNSSYERISNIVEQDKIIRIDATDKSTWDNGLGKCFTNDFSYSDYSTSEPTTKLSNSYKYLWIKLGSNLWVNLGDVSKYQ